MGRGLLSVAAAIAISFGAIGFSDAATKTEPLCGPVGGTTLVTTAKARVYSLPGDNPPFTERIFGCSPTAPHPWKLSRFGRSKFGGGQLQTPVLLSGVWAGGLVRSHGRDTYRYSMRSRNLRTGEEVACQAGGGINPRRGEKIYRVVLSQHGDLAWSGEYWRPIYEPQVEPGPGSTAPMPLPRKHILQCSGTGPAVIERGEDIEVDSLALSGQTLSWTNAGEEKTVRFPQSPEVQTQAASRQVFAEALASSASHQQRNGAEH